MAWLRHGPGGSRLDADRIRQAFVDHHQELFAFALRSLGDRGAAEDVVQETFLRAWRARSTFDAKRGELRPWLFQIARNVVVDYYRAVARQPAPGALDSQQPLPHDDLERLVQRCVVAEALASIPVDQRVAIEQTFLLDRSYQQLARELEVSESTLRSRVFYGLKTMRDILDGDAEEVRYEF